MAKKVEIIVGADNRPLKAALNDSRGDLKNFASFTTGLVAGFGISIFQSASSAVSSFFAGAQAEAEESQRVITSLRQSLEGAGRSDLFSGILSQADELQSKFKSLDNDDITAVFQRLITFGGLTQNQINKLLPLIIDLNAKQKLSGDVNRNLADTAEQVIKGIQGQGRELKLYGVEVDASKTSTENLGIIFDQLTPKVKGAADAFGNSLEGKLAAVTQRSKDLQEELGNKLLPLKVTLINFALQSASAFETLYQKITGTYEATQKAKKQIEALGASKENAKKFADGLTQFLGTATDDQFSNFTDSFEKEIDSLTKVLGDKMESSGVTDSSQFPKLSGQIQSYRDIIDALKEKRKLETDTTTIGVRNEELTVEKEKVDLLKEKITGLKEVVSLQRKGLKPDDILVTDASLELKNLEIKLIRRDTKDKSLAEEIIRLRYPDFDGKNIVSTRPIQVTAPFEVKSVAETITSIDAAGDDIAQGFSRMYAKITEQAVKDGTKAKEAIARPLEDLQGSLAGTLNDSLGNVGEAIGESLAGAANPAKAFVSIISTALQQIGKALIAYGIAKKAAFETIKAGIFSNPIVAIGAGIAAIAAGALLRRQLENSAPRLAEGGVTTGPTLAMIGEAGREVVAPLDKLRDLIGIGGGTQVEFVESRQRGGDLYEVWRIQHGRNKRLT